MAKPNATFEIRGGVRHPDETYFVLGGDTLHARIDDGELIVLPIGVEQLEVVFTPDELHDLWEWACQRMDWEWEHGAVD